MTKGRKESDLENLPPSVQDFLRLIIKKMRYRKKIRAEVQAELAGHFEDELKDCQDETQRQKRAQELIEQFGDPKLLGVLLRRAKKRCRPLWRTIVARTFQTVGVLILSFIAYTIWFLTGKPAVTIDYLSELNRVVCPVADNSQNAAPLFNEAVAVCPNMPERKAGFWGDFYLDVNDAEKKIIGDMVSSCSPSLELIAQGVQKPHFWREYETKKTAGDDGSLLAVLIPDQADFRELARALCHRAQIQAEKGQYSEAFDDLITCYKFGRLVGQGEKTLIEQLVGIAIQALATRNIREVLTGYDIGSKQLAVLQTDFARAQAGQEFRIRLLTEKLMVYDEIQRCFTEDRFGGGHLYPKRMLALGEMSGCDIGIATIVLEALTVPQNWNDAVRFMFFHPNKAETREQANAFYNYLEETSKMSPAQLRESEIDLDEQAESMVAGNIFMGILTPALNKIYQLGYRFKADTQSITVIIAVLRFKSETGEYPKDMNELMKFDYVNEIPIDPFSGEPLIYKETKDGFILYSVYLNFKDDCGKVHRDDKGRVEHWADQGDWVFWPLQK